VRRRSGRPAASVEPAITYLEPERHGAPVIPFVGLAESIVLAAVRGSGVPMQRIRPALNALEREIGIEHALASRRLYSDGAELLFEYGDRHRGSSEGDSALELVVVRSGQNVVADPTRAFGAPIFERGGVRVSDVLDRFWAGESLDDLSEDFGVPLDQLEDVLRVASRPAA